VAPEELAVGALHDAVVRVAALRGHDGRDARADALELVRRRIQHLKRLPDQRLAPAPEDRREFVVAVFDDAIAREHEADRREMKRGLIVERTLVGHGRGRHGGEVTYVFLRIVPQHRCIVPFAANEKSAASVALQGAAPA
jgi:hypothetical protein